MNRTLDRDARRDWHEKPPKEVRSVADALRSAEQRRRDLALVVQVHPWDWDEVILADEVHKLRRQNEMLMKANREGHRVYRT